MEKDQMLSSVSMQSQKQIDPAYVERLIEDVGRARVFARAKELGWADGGAPLWVWNQICLELKMSDDASATYRPRQMPA